MANELILALLRISLGTGVVVVALVAGRGLVRRACGADVAYCLWAAVPVTALAMLFEPDWGARWVEAAAPLVAPRAGALAAIWAAGAALSAGLLAIGHGRALARGRRGELGPAVAGLFNPRLYLPRDFAVTFGPAERDAIRAHERAHLLRHDVLANALMAFGQCLFWFNPLMHLAAEYLRRDQEMACDATVMDERPELRALYARTMLKAQSARPAPRIGCGFMRHPLEERIENLKAMPPLTLRVLGILGLTFLAVGLTIAFGASFDGLP